jgi:hypothetical protein
LRVGLIQVLGVNVPDSRSQLFKFDSSRGDVAAVMRDLAQYALLQARGDTFTFRNLRWDPPFAADCELDNLGLLVELSGDYSRFEGNLVMALTENFGPVTIEDI